MVVLVFIELIAGAMSYNPHHGLSADLPRVLHPVAMPGALRDDAMLVSIMRDGKVYLAANRSVPTTWRERFRPA